MKMPLRRLFAAFLCLSLTLPSPARACPELSRRTLRAGLEGTVESELSAGLEEPTTEHLIQRAERAAGRLLVALSKQKDFFEIQDPKNNRIYLSYRLAARLLKNNPSHTVFITRKPRSGPHPMVLAMNDRLETLFASPGKSIPDPVLRAAVSRLKTLGIAGIEIQSKIGLFRFWTKTRVDKAIQLSQKGKHPLSLQPNQITSAKQRKSLAGKRLFRAYNKVVHGEVSEYSSWPEALSENGFDAGEIYQTPLDQLRRGGRQEEVAFYVNPQFDEHGRLIPGQEPLLKKRLFSLSSVVEELARLSPVPIETIGLAGIQAQRRKVGTDGTATFILNRKNYSAYLPKQITDDEVPLLILLRMDDPYLRPQQARVLKSGAPFYPAPSQQQVFLNAHLNDSGELVGNPPLYVAAKSIGTALREDPDFKKASAVVITGVSTNDIGGTARFRNPFAENGDPLQLLTTARYGPDPPLRLNLQVRGTDRKTVAAAFDPSLKEQVFPRPDGFDFRRQRNGRVSYSATVDFLRSYHDETLPHSAEVSFERYLNAAQSVFPHDTAGLSSTVMETLRQAKKLELEPKELPGFFQFKTRALNGKPPAKTAAGLEEKFQAPEWQRMHARIVKALQSHPGGRRTRAELAELAGVGLKTLYRHDYRSLVAAENERRAGMEPPRPVIELGTEARIVKALQSHPGGRLTRAELAELAGVGLKTLSNHDYRSLVAAENERRAGMEPPRSVIELGVEAAIVKALQSHPGGRLMTAELAELAGVNKSTLSRHDYRSLVAAENERRAGMKPPRPVITLLGRGRHRPTVPRAYRPKEPEADLEEDSQETDRRRYDPAEVAGRLIESLLNPTVALPKGALSADGTLTLNPFSTGRLLGRRPTYAALRMDSRTGLHPITQVKNHLMLGLTSILQTAFSDQAPGLENPLFPLREKVQQLKTRSERSIRRIVIEQRRHPAPDRIPAPVKPAAQTSTKQPAGTKPTAVEITSPDQAGKILTNSEQSLDTRLKAVEFLLRNPSKSLLTVRELADFLEEYHEARIQAGLVPFSHLLRGSMDRYPDEPLRVWAEIFQIVQEAERKPKEGAEEFLKRKWRDSSPASSGLEEKTSRLQYDPVKVASRLLKALSMSDLLFRYLDPESGRVSLPYYAAAQLLKPGGGPSFTALQGNPGTKKPVSNLVMAINEALTQLAKEDSPARSPLSKLRKRGVTFVVLGKKSEQTNRFWNIARFRAIVKQAQEERLKFSKTAINSKEQRATPTGRWLYRAFSQVSHGRILEAPSWAHALALVREESLPDSPGWRNARRTPEEPRDLTEEILGRHPFKVRVLSGSEKDRAQLFLYDPVHNGFLDAGSLRTVSLEAQHRMIVDQVSGSLLLRTLEAGIPIPRWEMMSLVGSRTDEEFERQIQWLLGRRYAGDTAEGMRIIQQLRAQPTADLLKRAAEPRRPSETVPEPLLLLALLYKLREYAQDAYSINHIQSVQLAMAFLANNGDYQALKGSVNRALENHSGNPRRSSQTGIQNVSEIESVDLWQVKEGNTSVVYRVEVTIKGRPEPVFFALNIAKDATAATKAVEAAWLTLSFYYETDPAHVMEPYLYTELELALGEGARATRRSIGVLTGEWVPGDEIHLYVRPDGTPDMRVWTNQQSPGKSLTGEETDLVWQETVRMQARYSPLILADEGTLPMVQPALIALNAGDLVWYRDSSGVSGPILIWPWGGPYDLPMEAAEFLVYSLLVSAVDQETSAAVRQNFWGQPERALEIVREEFSEKFRAAARAADVSDADAFVRAQWRAVVRDAAGWVIPRYFEDPGLFLPTWFFNPAEVQQANAQLRATQTALQAHLASLAEDLSSGLEERADAQILHINADASFAEVVASAPEGITVIYRLYREFGDRNPGLAFISPLQNFPTPADAAPSIDDALMHFFGVSARDMSYFVQVSDQLNQPDTVWIDIAPAKETVTLSIPGDLNQTTIPGKLLEALKDKPLPVKAALVTFFLSEIIDHINEHDYGYKKELSTRVTLTWDSKEVQVVLEDQSFTDPDDVAKEILAQADTAQAAATSGRTGGKVASIMMKRAHRAGELSLKEETHTPGQGTRRVLVFKKPSSAAGLEENVAFSDKNLSFRELRVLLDAYVPWGFDYFDGSEEERNLLGGGADFPLGTPWKGFDDLHVKFIQPTERTRFQLTILQSAPWFPEDRSYAIIVGYSPGPPPKPRTGLEENDLESKFRRSARTLQDRGWFLNADSFTAAFLKTEEFLKQDLAIFEQRALKSGGADKLRRKWRKAIENKKLFLPAFSALMERLSEPASGNHALTVAHWKSSEKGYRATLEYRFENQLVRAFLTVNRNPEFPILRIYLSRKIYGGNPFLPIAQVRIGKDREPADLHSKPPLHLDILIPPQIRSWVEHKDLMPVWSINSGEDPAQVLGRFQNFLASLESYLKELPAAGLEEPVRFSNRTMFQVATLLEDHPQALLAVSLPPRNRNDRREVFREMAPSSAEAAERFLNKIPRALREQAKRFSYDVEILLPANESQPAQIRVTAYRPFPGGEPTQIFRGLTGSQLFPILAEFRPYPIRVIRPVDARASAEQRILEIPAEENPIRTVKATVQKFLSDKELAPEDDQVRYTLLVFENPTGEEGLAVAAEVRIRAPEFPLVSASSGLEERRAKSVNLLRQVPPAVPGSVGHSVLVFRDPATFDLAALAVQWGWSVAVLDDGPEADALKELLDALPGPKGSYAVGLLESSLFLEGYPSQILIEDRPEGFRVLGLRWDDLPPPVAGALESVLIYLDRVRQA